MQRRFAQDNFSKKSPCIAMNTQKKFQKSICEELIPPQKYAAVGTLTLTLPSLMSRLQGKGMQK